jgi:hypothetical protein
MMKNRFRIETYRIRGLSYEIGLILTFLPILLITIGGMISVNASSNEVSCFELGIIDGEDHPFNQRTYDNCGNDYYQGFLEGCMSVEGNNMVGCESATDA